VENNISEYIAEVARNLQVLPVTEINEMVALLHEARLQDRQVFVMGNGGSAATATHFVADLIKNTRSASCPDFRVIGLADNMATFSAYGNDEGYETVFASQLASLARPGDVVVAISTSGNSPNVLEAMRVARQKRLVTIGLTGNDGGQLGDMVQLNVHVPNWRPDQTEDVHLVVLHSVTAILREKAKQLKTERRDTVAVWRYEYASPGESVSHGRYASAPLERLFEQLDQDQRALADSPELLGSMLLHITQSLHAASGSFALLDESMRVSNAALVYSGSVSEADPNNMEAFVQRGLAGWAVQNRQPALLPSTHRDRRWLEHHKTGMLKSARSVICVPIIMEERVAGVITLSRPDSDPFSGKEMLLLTGIIAALTSRIHVNKK
jgi:D-sedoheptulose 7-phosphate isomerase